MAIDDTELDYTKIRDAMDLASENLRKKEEKDKLKTKDEQEKSETKTKEEKKNDAFKWIAYGGVIFVGILII